MICWSLDLSVCLSDLHVCRLTPAEIGSSHCNMKHISMKSLMHSNVIYRLYATMSELYFLEVSFSDQCTCRYTQNFILSDCHSWWFFSQSKGIYNHIVFFTQFLAWPWLAAFTHIWHAVSFTRSTNRQIILTSRDGQFLRESHHFQH